MPEHMKPESETAQKPASKPDRNAKTKEKPAPTDGFTFKDFASI